MGCVQVRNGVLLSFVSVVLAVGAPTAPVWAASYSFNSEKVSPSQVNPGQSVNMSMTLVPGASVPNAIVTLEAIQGSTYFNAASKTLNLVSGQSVSVSGTIALPAGAPLGTY